MLTLALCGMALGQSDAPPAGEPFVLMGEQDKQTLGQYLEILEDSGGELTIEEVVAPEFDALFVPSQDEVPNYGFTDSAYWVRLPMENPTDQTVERLLEVGFANMHFVDLYIPSPNGTDFTVKQTGALRPFASRDIAHPRIVFDVAIPPESQESFYLRFENGASMTLPLSLSGPQMPLPSPR
jgi:hypothetical protein